MEIKRDEYIFKKLKEHLNYLKQAHPKYNVIYLGLQGSQNYNLDVYSDEYMSDVDTKAILVPSLEEISLNKKPISTTVVLPDNSHCDCKDIRLMMQNFKKLNINFIEILFTKYKIINPEYKDLMLELIDKREEIAHMNFNQSLRCMAGMSMEKRKALTHPYEGLKDKIAKYGYDGKQLHHIIRMNNFIKAFVDGNSFEECLTMNNNLELLMDAKLNKPTLEEALQIADKYDEETHQIMVNNLLEEDQYNTETNDFMDNIQYQVIKRAIQSEIDSEQTNYNEFSYLDLDKKYDNIYVISDLHFYHSNIIKFEENRQKLLDETQSQYVSRKIKEDNVSPLNEVIDNYMNLYYKDKVEVMNKALIENWNKTVTKNDLVFILGDLSLGYMDVNNVNNIIEQLNGDKILIKGNHDYEIVNSKKFNKALFKDIKDYLEVSLYGKQFVMCHYPILHFNKQYKGTIHLYGHMHAMPMDVKYISHGYNVCADVNNYKPVNIIDFIKMDDAVKML